MERSKAELRQRICELMEQMEKEELGRAKQLAWTYLFQEPRRWIFIAPAPRRPLIIGN